MIHEYFKTLESHTTNTSLNLNEVLDQLAFSEQGLIPVITQVHRVTKC